MQPGQPISSQSREMETAAPKRAFAVCVMPKLWVV
jgi:hypothetical protein